jgi:hypothetical protein
MLSIVTGVILKKVGFHIEIPSRSTLLLITALVLLKAEIPIMEWCHWLLTKIIIIS